MTRLIGILVGPIELKVDKIREDILYIMYNNTLQHREYPDNVIYIKNLDTLESLIRANSNLVASEDVLITRHKDINEGIITDIRRRIERIKANLPTKLGLTQIG